jgi:hypothetical protein
MRISIIPWEFIWLIGLLVLIVTTIWTAIGQIKRRKFGWPGSFFFYGALIVVTVIPAGLKLTHYRFKLNGQTGEVTRLGHEIPDLVSRDYDQYTVKDVYEASLRAIQASKTYGQPWRVKFAGLTREETARISVDVPVFFVTEALDITIELKGSVPGLRVIAFADSPTIKRDYGENARHIVQFYEALEAELAELPETNR